MCKCLDWYQEHGVWTGELHRRFEAAVNTLGIDQAKPQARSRPIASAAPAMPAAEMPRLARLAREMLSRPLIATTPPLCTGDLTSDELRGRARADAAEH